MEIKYTKLIIITIIEIIVFFIISIIISRNILYTTRMTAGSHLWLAPFVFYKEVYSNSSLIEKNFNLFYLLINIIIILFFAFIFSTKLNKNKKWK